MRKSVIILLLLIGTTLFTFTYTSAKKAFRSDWELPKTTEQKQPNYRLVLIAQDLQTPFWNRVIDGAMEQAKKDGVSLEVRGSFGINQDDFLKKMEIAIHSKVDGIIVQGLDTDEFKELTRIKATFYGIPIITIANDVPMPESLRKTYVGSDQYSAGKLVASQLIKDMGPKGNVILMCDARQAYYQKQRIKGIQEVLENYPDIRTTVVESPQSRDKVITATQDMLNRLPDVHAFIVVNANIAGAMIQEIGKRSQVEPYFIYSFDDGPESLKLLKHGNLDGILEQSPKMMGKKSVELMMKLLQDEKVTLDMEGYITDIQMLKATDMR